MIAIIYLLNLFGPIIVILGLFGSAFLMQGELDEWLWTVSGICGFIGIFFCIASWSYGIPPRWFWSKSQVDLFSSKVGCVIGNMIQFFLFPLRLL